MIKDPSCSQPRGLVLAGSRALLSGSLPSWNNQAKLCKWQEGPEESWPSSPPWCYLMSYLSIVAGLENKINTQFPSEDSFNYSFLEITNIKTFWDNFHLCLAVFFMDFFFPPKRVLSFLTKFSQDPACKICPTSIWSERQNVPHGKGSHWGNRTVPGAQGQTLAQHNSLDF